MNQTIIARGAEAIITKTGKIITKNRIEKSYRYPELDKKIRKLRTRSETKILEKVFKIIPSPKLISSNEIKAEIKMQYVEGKKLAESLEKTKFKEVCKQIGNNLAKIHDAGIIHGDLTTSNLILNEKENKVYFIDFGLSFHSARAEDKAVDLHLIKQALEAKHPSIYQETYSSIIKGYKKESKKAKETLAQLEKVERRGRYKEQY